MKRGIASNTTKVLRQLGLLVAALWLVASSAEGAHRHTEGSRCIQCLCLPPGRRKTELVPIDFDSFVLRTVDTKQTRLFSPASPYQAAEQAVAPAPEVYALATRARLTARRRFACPTVRLLSFVLKTGPPRAPPPCSSSS